MRWATAVLHAIEDEHRPPARDMSALLAAHSHREEGAEVRKRLDQLGVQYGPAFTGLATVRTGEAPAGTVLAEVAAPDAIRSQQAAYGVHPALLDACFQSVEAHPDVQAVGEDVLVLPSGIRRLRAYGPLRNARYCYTRVTRADAIEVEADLDVLDEHGTVLLTARGLQMGKRVSDEDHEARVLGKRLLTIEWQKRELPEATPVDARKWLLVSTSPTADVVATKLTDALKLLGAECTTTVWPQPADPSSNGHGLESQLRPGGFGGVVVLTGPTNGNPDEECALRGAEYVRHLVRIAREVLEISGEPPRLYLVTSNAQPVVAGDCANLEQGGLRGLMRVIGTEYPHLRPTQIDVDEDTEAEQVARQLLEGSEEDETAWRNDEWYHGALAPHSAAPGGAADHHCGPRARRHAPADPYAR